MKKKLKGLAFAMTLMIAATLLPPVSQPALAAGAKPVAFESIFKYNGKVYATKNFCVKGWKLVKNTETFCIYNNYIYYVEGWEPSVWYGGSLYRCKLNGTGRTRLAKYCSVNLYFRDGKIYFDGAANEDGKSRGVYCYDLKTKKKSKLLSNCAILSCDSDNIYYRPDKGGVYRCSYKGKSKTLVTNLKGYDYGIVHKNYYYCVPFDGQSIYRIEKDKLKGFDRVVNIDQYSQGFILNSGWIYYVYKNAIYRCKLNGSGAKKLCPLNKSSYGAYPVKVVGKYLYFIEFTDADKYNCFLYRVPAAGGKKVYMNKKWFES